MADDELNEDLHAYQSYPSTSRSRRAVTFSESVTVGTAAEVPEADGFECSPCCRSRRFRRTLVNLLLGQILSLCLCLTGVTSQYLSETYKVNAPTTQSFVSYFLLCLVYGTALSCRPFDTGIVAVLRDRGWKYVIVALLDVEANFLIVLAYQYTNLTSIQLLDCWTIPVVLLLSWLCLSVRYGLSHVLGVAVCLIGVACLVAADALAGKGSSGGSERLKGDMLCLAGASLYGVSNVAEEWLVRSFDRLEYLGMVGLFGSLISGLQLAILERQALATVDWSNWRILLLFGGFAGGMFVFYSLVAEVMRRAGATMFNLSVLTADFYTLLAGLILFQYKFHILYFVSFAVVLLGSVVYSLRPTGQRCEEDGPPPIGRCLPASPCCPCFREEASEPMELGDSYQAIPGSSTPFILGQEPQPPPPPDVNMYCPVHGSRSSLNR